MTKTDYELTIGGKLRKVYKNSGGFFVKMNGGNLDVNEYFLKNGGGLKSKYRNKNKGSSKDKNKKKITGGYPISLIKNNTKLKEAVEAFITSIGITQTDNSLPDINFVTPIQDASVPNNSKQILNHIIKNFYTEQGPQEPQGSQGNTNSKSYNVIANGVTGVEPIIINENTNYSENIKDDIKNFYKMYILYYFFTNYITEQAQITQNPEQNSIVTDNYTKFFNIENTIEVRQQT